MSDSMTEYLEKEFGNFQVSVKCGYNKLMVKNCPWCELLPNGITCRYDKLTGCSNYAVIDGALRLAELKNHEEWNTYDNWYTCQKHEKEGE